MQDQESFRVLAEFLDTFGEDVAGRAHEEPPPEVLNRLAQFARGELAEADRTDLVSQLKDNPHWVSFLAREVKNQRGSA